MDVDLYINSTLRTDLVVTRLRRSYVDPWTAEINDPGRHDSGDHPLLWSDVRVENADTGTVLFRGEITDYAPGGVAQEGATLTASGPTWHLKNTNVRINGRSHYTWNHRGGTGQEGQAGYDSPGKDGEKWTAGEICVDILEHALGTTADQTTTTTGSGTSSAIPGHHSDDEDVTDTYLGGDAITGWTPSDWLALDTVIGEFSVEDTSLADALELLVSRAGGFYGWYVDAAGTLHLVDMDGLGEQYIEAGEQGHWVGEDGTDYRLLNNQLQWSLDGVASKVVVQGKDRTVEEKPNNIEGSGNPGKGDLGEMELLSEPWEGYDSAFRPRYQDKRHITLKSIDENDNYTPPSGWWNFNHSPRLYVGTPSGDKTVYDPSSNVFPDVVASSGAVGLYETPGLGTDEKLWLWYWAAVPFTVEAGPAGDAYEHYGYSRTLTIYDESFRHPDSYPQSGDSDESTRMQTLADRMLDQRKDVRRQGTLRVDGAEPSTYGLDARYSVQNLGPTTTTSGATTTTTAGPEPTDWRQLKINAVEVTYDLERDLTDIRVANTFFMLEGYSEIKRRLLNNLGRAREQNRQYYTSYTQPNSDSPEGTETEPDPAVGYMIVASENMTGDNTAYDCQALDSDGSMTTNLTAKRPNGSFVAAGDVGYLGKDTDGDNLFIPAGTIGRGATEDTISQNIGDGEGADNTSWDATSDETTGLDLTIVTRVDYYDAGNETLYGYERFLRFDEEGRLLYVGPESRKTIDVPESC